MVVHGQGQHGHGELGLADGAHEDGEPVKGAVGHGLEHQVGYEGTDGGQGDTGWPGPGG